LEAKEQFFFIVGLCLILVAGSVFFFEEAEAKKSDGTPLLKVMSDNVCGNMLTNYVCSIEEKIARYLGLEPQGFPLDPGSRFSVGGVSQQSIPSVMMKKIDPISSPKTKSPPPEKNSLMIAKPLPSKSIADKSKSDTKNQNAKIIKDFVIPELKDKSGQIKTPVPGKETKPPIKPPTILMPSFGGTYEIDYPLGIPFSESDLIPVQAQLPSNEIIVASCTGLDSLERMQFESETLIFFGLGTTTIECSAMTPSGSGEAFTTEESNNRSSQVSETVIVQDTKKPIPLFPEIDGPLYAEDGRGVEIDFTEYIWAVNYLTEDYYSEGVASLPDYAFEDVTIDCNYPRNNFYQIGRHEIECSFRDKGGNAVTDSIAFIVEGPDIPEFVEEEPEIPENNVEESQPTQTTPQEDEILLQPGFDLTTDKISYNTGDMITISGSGLDQTEEISVYIITSDGDEFTNLQIYSTNDGIFSTPWIIPSHMSDGTYFVIATTSTLYAEAAFEIGTSSLDSSNIVDNPTPQIEQDATTELPSWIKSNAAWWSNDAIEDADFLQGIEYLIQQGIIVVPLTESSSDSQSNQPLPDWIKNNAAWWSQDLIGNDEFINAIQWLLENGIIRI